LKPGKIIAAMISEGRNCFHIMFGIINYPIELRRKLDCGLN